METMKAVAEVSESTKAEAVAAVQRQCQEEVASLQAILKGEELIPNTPTSQPVNLCPSNREYRTRRLQVSFMSLSRGKSVSRFEEKHECCHISSCQPQLGVALTFTHSLMAVISHP